ncbi:hypothetical protein Nepgr_029714 [Nepenthes gracilis]|uniref:Uncharacterized protein n=1 Tax=Nepenthes gracilis TaxID=150966 RepID=A0AAD3Y5T1_NEPGR|nr:hypothetical protein Nepgr_029714 [Nepenthes gracilis]
MYLDGKLVYRYANEITRMYDISVLSQVINPNSAVEACGSVAFVQSCVKSLCGNAFCLCFERRSCELSVSNSAQSGLERSSFAEDAFVKIEVKILLFGGHDLDVICRVSDDGWKLAEQSRLSAAVVELQWSKFIRNLEDALSAEWRVDHASRA